VAIEKHVVQLEARDNLSKAFQNVGKEAENAGRKAEDAGRKGTRASADWGRAASALGAGLGVLTVAAVRLGNESEVVQRRLQTSIENTGAAYEDLADQIDAAAEASLDLAFDDEDALNAIAELTDATGDAEKAIIDLGIAQDVARGRGISLAAATDLVVAAETGRTQSLRRVGIVLDENATKEDYLAALQQKYAGQAEAYAETNAATWDRVGNTVENKLESIGGALAAFQGPLIAIGAGAQVIGPLGDAFEALNGKAKLAAAGSRALSLALGPVGIAAALGVATVAAVKWYQSLEYTKVTTDDVTEATDNFARSIAELGMGGASQDVLQILADTADVYKDLGEFSTIYAEKLGNLKQREADLNIERANSGDIDRINQIDRELEQLKTREAFYESMILTQDQFNEVQSDSIHLLTNLNSLNADVVTARYQELWQQFKAGTISADELAWQINWLDENSATYGLTLEQIAKQQEIATDAQGDLTLAIEHTATAYSSSLPVLDESTGKVLALANITNAYSDSVETNADRLEDFVDSLWESNAAADAFAVGVANMHAEVAAMDAALASLAETLEFDAAGAADRALNMVVGFTNGMVDSIQAAKEWTDAFSGKLGTDFMDDGSMSRLLQLLRMGKIDQEDYNEVLTSQTRIYNDLLRAEQAAAIIQAKQSDVVADGTEATADYLVELSKLDEANQTIALGWADMGLADQATQIADMAAGWGDMSDAQQTAFEEMVTSAAAMDPVLAAMLEDMGLIKKSATDPTGWEISMDSSDAESDLDRVTDAIDDLVETLEKIYNLNIEPNDETAMALATRRRED